MLLYILFSLLSLALGFVAGVLWDDDDSSILDDNSWLDFANRTPSSDAVICWGCDGYEEESKLSPTALCVRCEFNSNIAPF